MVIVRTLRISSINAVFVEWPNNDTVASAYTLCVVAQYDAFLASHQPPTLYL
jgi:hypothetical protein